MTDVRDSVAALALLEGVDAARLDRFHALVEPVAFSPGQVVVAEGDPADHFGLVLDGRATVTDGRSRREIGTAGPGSVIGELGLLRHARRNATVTATTTLRMVVGGLEAFAELLAIEEVRTRLVRQAAQHLAGSVRTVEAHLADGSAVALRPILPGDADAFREALDQLSAESRRLRFFTAAPLPPSLIRYLTDLDYRNHFAWVVLPTRGSGQTGLGSGRFVRVADRPEVAEVALAVADEHQRRGVGRLLLGALAVAADEAGIELFEGEVLRENRASLALFNSAGAERVSVDRTAVRMTVRPRDLLGELDDDVAAGLRHTAAEVLRLARIAIAPAP